MSLDTLTSNQFAVVISQAAASAFMLGAVASFLTVLFSQLNLLLEKARAISSPPKVRVSSAQTDIAAPQLKTRIIRIGWAIFRALGSGVAKCFVIIAAFAGAWFGIQHEIGAAILFTSSLIFFTAALIPSGMK